MIDKIGNIGKILQPSQKAQPKKAPAVKGQADSVSISAEAQKAAEVASHIKTVKNAPDSERAEKLKEVKLKLKNGDYDNLSQEMLEKIADRIAPSILK